LIREEPFLLYDLATYFSKNISYTFTQEKRKGMALFLEMLKEQQDLPEFESLVSKK